MLVTTFLTQRQLMTKNMPADALTGPYAQQQKMLLYVLPVVFAVGGVAFPIGVLIYWTDSNLWTMGQQFYVIRRNPAPGTPAAKAKEARDADKAATQGPARHRRGRPPRAEGTAASQAGRAKPKRPAPRAQPKKQSRSQRHEEATHAEEPTVTDSSHEHTHPGEPRERRTRPPRPSVRPG